MSTGINISSMCLIALFAVNGLRADVVGCDAEVGHIGLCQKFGSKVMAVGGIDIADTGLNHTNIIEQSLSDFQAAGYWGIRYDHRTTLYQRVATWLSLYHQSDYHASYSLVAGSWRHRVISDPSKEIVIGGR